VGGKKTYTHITQYYNNNINNQLEWEGKVLGFFNFEGGGRGKKMFVC
jgi:hypothetical protein